MAEEDKVEVEEAPKRRGRQGGMNQPKNPKYVAAMEIVCAAKDRERVAEEEYSKRQEPNGSLMLKNDKCGSSMVVKDFSLFPKVNRACGCGRPGHFFVKYSVS